MTSAYRVLITGSRTWEDREAIEWELAGLAILYPEAVIVHGACPRGADAMADAAARTLGLAVERHPADWAQGKSAGFRRNAEMVALGAIVCLAFIRDGSRGATHCAELAAKAGIPVRRFTMPTSERMTA